MKRVHYPVEIRAVVGAYFITLLANSLAVGVDIAGTVYDHTRKNIESWEVTKQIKEQNKKVRTGFYEDRDLHMNAINNLISKLTCMYTFNVAN